MFLAASQVVILTRNHAGPASIELDFDGWCTPQANEGGQALFYNNEGKHSCCVYHGRKANRS